MTWIYKRKKFTEVPEGIIAFVYEITNDVDGRKYIGKKLFKFTRSTKKKGKRVKKQVDSDWLDYYGSNKELLGDVEALGKKSFTRKITKSTSCNKKRREAAFATATSSLHNGVPVLRLPVSFDAVTSC